jgi:hypothetical protein
MVSSPLSRIDFALKYTQNEHSLTSSDEYNDDVMPVIADVQSINISKSKKRSRATRTSLVTYGPIRIRKRHTKAPTLATGRRSKDDLIEGEDMKKRELRRMKNRESARNLKKLRDNIEHDLACQVNQLEYEEHNLTLQVNNLQTYKQYLEDQCRQIYPIYEIITRTASAILSEYKKQQTLQNHTELIKEEPRPPSPQWQLLFRI